MRDSELIRGQVPMTKSEVRAVSLDKLDLPMDAVFWDIGAGTGSVSIEAARYFSQRKDGRGRIYAIEKEEKAIALIEQNRKKLVPDYRDFYIIEGEAPDVLKKLPVPTHVFIGGTGGELEEIVRYLLHKNPKVRIVINSITAETFCSCIDLIKALPLAYYEIIQMSVTHLEPVGRYHMHKALNPVYIALLQGEG